MRYASETTVSVEKSRAEIESTVRRYGASGFISGWLGNQAMIQFEARGRRVKFILTLPDKGERRFTHTPGRGMRRSPAEAEREWEQGCRQSWRALALCIKAKLEAVEAGITTFEHEFMAHIVLPSGLTVAETIMPDLLAGRALPPLLPGPAK